MKLNVEEKRKRRDFSGIDKMECGLRIAEVIERDVRNRALWSYRTIVEV